MAGALLTEGTFIPRPTIKFIDSGFEQRYLVQRNRAMATDFPAVRAHLYGFTSRGYVDYGSPTPLLERTTDHEQLLQDWYVYARDIGKRSLKYKHTPTTLTDDDMLIYLLDANGYVIMNVGALLNLNRLPHYNPAFGVLAAALPPYMSRLNRLWRRASANKIPNLWRAHFLRNSSIFGMDQLLAPTLRLWSNKFLLPAGSGGPTVTDIAATVCGMLTNATHLGTFVTNLENVQRWIEVGSAAIATDFIAVKDVIDMISDVPALKDTFATGLPRADEMPGYVEDASLVNEMLTRAIGLKDQVTAGTDTWSVIPSNSHGGLGNRSLVMGFGQPHPLYDFTTWGVPKFSCSLWLTNVDVAARFLGTDFPLRNYMTIANQDIRDFFGFDVQDPATAAEEELFADGAASPDPVNGKMVNWNDADDIREAIKMDSTALNHVHWKWGPYQREATPTSFRKQWDETKVHYWFFPDAQDYPENMAVLTARTFGIPPM
jgi:hypothetical protein